MIFKDVIIVSAIAFGVISATILFSYDFDIDDAQLDVISADYSQKIIQ